ncbi:hypothetical protein [Burkholderia cepacia]|uniref:hypothetical protein n=1 Tax=Burkholderia cepacia TaxID=292 RepID=UPI002FE0251A
MAGAPRSRRRSALAALQPGGFNGFHSFAGHDVIQITEQHKLPAASRLLLVMARGNRSMTGHAFSTSHTGSDDHCAIEAPDHPRRTQSNPVVARPGKYNGIEMSKLTTIKSSQPSG